MSLNPLNHVDADEILAYAKFLGMDLEEDKDLLWIAEEGLSAPLPAGWTSYEHDDAVYYYNTATKESVWEHPLDDFYKEKYQKEKEKKKQATSKATKVAQPIRIGSAGKSSLMSLKSVKPIPTVSALPTPLPKKSSLESIPPSASKPEEIPKTSEITFQQQIEKLELEKRSLYDSVENLNEELATLRQTLQSQQSANDNVVEVRQNYEQQLSKLKNENSLIQQQLEKLELEKRTSFNNLESLKEEVDTLRQQLLTQQSSSDNVVTLRQNYEQQISKLKTENLNNERQIEKLELEKRSLYNTVESLKEEVVTLGQQLQSQQTTNSDVDLLRHNYEQQLSKLKTENSLIQQQLEKLELEKRTSFNNLESLKEEVDTLRQQLLTQQSSSDNVVTLRQNYEQQISKLKTENLNNERQIEKLELEKRSLYSTVESLKEEVVTLGQQQPSKHTDSVDVAQLRQNYDKQISKLKSENSTNERELEKLEREKRLLLNNVESLKEEVAELHEQLDILHTKQLATDSLKEEVIQLRQQLADVQQPTSHVSKTSVEGSEVMRSRNAKFPEKLQTVPSNTVDYSSPKPNSRPFLETCDEEELKIHSKSRAAVDLFEIEKLKLEKAKQYLSQQRRAIASSRSSLDRKRKEWSDTVSANGGKVSSSLAREKFLLESETRKLNEKMNQYRTAQNLLNDRELDYFTKLVSVGLPRNDLYFDEPLPKATIAFQNHFPLSAPIDLLSDVNYLKSLIKRAEERGRTKERIVCHYDWLKDFKDQLFS
ncbi:hypothetical protein RCL1_002861 [Eukaryota sp. TZLM3-RCL]